MFKILGLAGWAYYFVGLAALRLREADPRTVADLAALAQPPVPVPPPPVPPQV